MIFEKNYCKNQAMLTVSNFRGKVKKNTNCLKIINV